MTATVEDDEGAAVGVVIVDEGAVGDDCRLLAEFEEHPVSAEATTNSTTNFTS